MKLKWTLPVMLALMMAGCGKDNVTTVDNDSSDDVSDVSFDGTITVVFSSGGASVSGAGSDQTVTIDGNDVTIVNGSNETIEYDVSGSASDGFLKIYSSAAQAINLNGVSLTNANGAAINVQGSQSSPSQGAVCYVVVSGSNSLADGSSYTDTPTDEDEKGVIFAEGALVFSGSGSLTVTAKGKAGIASDEYVRFTEGTTTVSSSAGNGVKANDLVRVSDGTLNITVSADMKKGISSDDVVRFDGGTTTITVTGGTAYDSEDAEYTGSAGVKADGQFLMEGGSLTITNSGTGGKGISGDGEGIFSGGTVKVTCSGSNYGSGGNGPGGGSSSSSVSAKGIKFDGNLTFSGSTVVVSCSSHEGIESKGTIDITDGQVYSYASDDAINSASTFTIDGGYVCAYSTGNDGLDANGNLYVKGGLVYAIGASSPEVAMDANTEGGYNLYLSGGTIIAVGGLESGASLSQSCYSASSWSSSTWYGLTVGSTTYAFKTPSSGGTPLVVSGSSTPSLSSGVTVSGGTSYFEGMMKIGASVSGGSSVSLSSYSGGNGGGGTPGGGGPGGGGWAR